jgi:hypothetical protein
MSTVNGIVATHQPSPPTRRHRLQPLAAGCTSEGGDTAPDRVLFLAGTSYCGSTLTSFLLNAHPDVVSVGEETGPAKVVKDKLSFPCSCGALLPECGFWRQVVEQMQKRGLAFGPTTWGTNFRLSPSAGLNHLLARSLRNNVLDDLRDACVSALPPWRRRLETIASRNAALIQVILQLTGKRVFAAAGKDPIRARFLNRIPSLDLRVVHLTRDAPGYVSSAMKNNGVSCEVGIRDWLRGAGHAIRLFEHLAPEQCLRVRYEDLCRNVEGEVGRMVRFAGLEPAKGPIRFRDVEHHIIGNRMRLESSDEVVLDERWKERLTKQQVSQIERATAPMRGLFGYV